MSVQGYREVEVGRVVLRRNLAWGRAAVVLPEPFVPGDSVEEFLDPAELRVLAVEALRMAEELEA